MELSWSFWTLRKSVESVISLRDCVSVTLVFSMLEEIQRNYTYLRNLRFFSFASSPSISFKALSLIYWLFERLRPLRQPGIKCKAWANGKSMCSASPVLDKLRLTVATH